MRVYANLDHQTLYPAAAPQPSVALPPDPTAGRRLRLGYKLTLVSAPAGFGKTTLVSDWLHQLAGKQGSKGAGGVKSNSFFVYRCSNEYFESVARASLCPTRQRIGMCWLRVKIIF